ncbi:hypothetical protein [Mesorhizobium sp. CAU 1732]|uniref:hypothetical protein n=1 Tax=Mesorhizobium sp. CAU 1732 TaxID=3140358 RepID=UPI003260166C
MTAIDMTRRNSSLGFFGTFGRSADLRMLDKALRAVDLHPAQVPEGAKLTIVNLMKDHFPHGEPPESAYGPVAELFGYCLVGPNVFALANGPDSTASAERRLEMAIDRSESLDGQLVLLAIHSKLISPVVVDRYELSVE